ncbi:hypothetical protein CEXT_591451 [Caerostris extrusa]|uniref:Uncharacterized protein n=1 Tax=Caerostris extrusa TaxID=172846 RepID=A0AAV4TNR5_CAEEX|nr:hypothetical protein CEXT_591451 [Caerostris extrusa]
MAFFSRTNRECTRSYTAHGLHGTDRQVFAPCPTASLYLHLSPNEPFWNVIIYLDVSSKLSFVPGVLPGRGQHQPLCHPNGEGAPAPQSYQPDTKHAHPGDAAAGHAADAGQRAAAVLLRLLHLRHRGVQLWAGVLRQRCHLDLPQRLAAQVRFAHLLRASESVEPCAALLPRPRGGQGLHLQFGEGRGAAPVPGGLPPRRVAGRVCNGTAPALGGPPPDADAPASTGTATTRAAGRGTRTPSRAPSPSTTSVSPGSPSSCGLICLTIVRWSEEYSFDDLMGQLFKWEVSKLFGPRDATDSLTNDRRGVCLTLQDKKDP